MHGQDCLIVILSYRCFAVQEVRPPTSEPVGPPGRNDRLPYNRI